MFLFFLLFALVCLYLYKMNVYMRERDVCMHWIRDETRRGVGEGWPGLLHAALKFVLFFFSAFFFVE